MFSASSDGSIRAWKLAKPLVSFTVICQLYVQAPSVPIIRSWWLLLYMCSFLNQSGSTCVSAVETGSRLTCITVVNPEALLKKLAEKEDTEGIIHTFIAHLLYMPLCSICYKANCPIFNNIGWLPIHRYGRKCCKLDMAF